MIVDNLKYIDHAPLSRSKVEALRKRQRTLENLLKRHAEETLATLSSIGPDQQQEEEEETFDSVSATIKVNMYICVSCDWTRVTTPPFSC